MHRQHVEWMTDHGKGKGSSQGGKGGVQGAFPKSRATPPTAAHGYTWVNGGWELGGP